MKFLYCLTFLLACLGLSAHAQTADLGQLPEGLDKKTFLQWIAPEEDHESPLNIGAKPWDTDKYVAMACFSDGSECPEWHKDSEAPLRVYLGVFRMENQQFVPIARTLSPLELSDMDYFGATRAPDYLKFDLADYRLNKHEKAFGIRWTLSEGFAKGHASTTNLQLFMIQEDEIVNIFNKTISKSAATYGGSDASGTWPEYIREIKTTIHVLKTSTHGFYDWRVKTTSSEDDEEGKERAIKTDTKYIWSPDAKRYVPASGK